MSENAVYQPRHRRIEATTLGDLLDQRAEEHATRSALVFPDHAVTYAELAARVEFLARGLLGLGVRPRDPIGILSHDCADSVALVLAAAKIGALPVPVNARFKTLELRQVLAHSGMRLLVTSAPSPGNPDFPALLRETFPSLADHSSSNLALPEVPSLSRIVVLGASAPQRQLVTEVEFTRAANTVSGEQLAHRQEMTRIRDTALVLYTSGTTASPKGALISHEAIFRIAAGLTNDRFDLTPRDRVWTALPLFHIGGLAFALACLYAGCTYCHTGRFEPAAALRHLETQRCTIALPGFETVWLPVVNQPDFGERDLSALRLVMVVGVPERLRDMASRLPHATHVSCFGMTEATSFLSLNRPTDTWRQRINTGGHPMPGMECRIIDLNTGEDLPPDTSGELLFRGSNCFDGYFRDPELTKQAFDSEGWFHTGDIATMDPDGRVTFVGRVKDMLKVGGENVAAAEVENYLLQHPAVHIAQIVGAPDKHYGEVPAAFLELKPGMSVDENDIIDYCMDNIATYRVPRYVRFVDSWPMSGTKIKKYVLRETIRDELRDNGITHAPKPRTQGTKETQG